MPHWLIIIAPWLTGGLFGAILTWIISWWRNRIQPVGRRITVSYMEFPTNFGSLDAQITLVNRSGEDETLYHFKQLALIKLDFINKGNKDLSVFDVGVNVPISAKIFSIQYKSSDRYHEVKCTPQVSIENPSSQLDLELKNFSRKEKYSITLVVDTNKEKNLEDNIILSKSLPVKFVNMDDTSTHMEARFIAILVLAPLILSVAIGYFSFQSSEAKSTLSLIDNIISVLIIAVLSTTILTRKGREN